MIASSASIGRHRRSGPPRQIGSSWVWSKVHLVRGDLVAGLKGPVDLLLANLPYLRPDQRAGNPDLRVEPEIALVGGRDGLDAIRGLLADAPRVLATDGAIALEIDPSQVDAVVDLARAVLPDARPDVLRDLAGLDRIVVADRRAGR
jgi:methylase of polypeptide subunit release factors